MRKLTLTFKIVAVLMLLVCAQHSHAQQTFQTSASGTPYVQYLPAEWALNPTKKFPVIIVLHGTGERGTNLNQILNTGVSKVIQAGHNMKFKAGGTGPEFSFIVMSPQITGSWNAPITEGLINHAINTLRGDPSRIYLTGFSLGGNGTWIFSYNARNNPNRLAATAPIAGWGGAHLVCALGNYQYAVWAHHGDADATIEINRHTQVINAYNACVPAPNPLALYTIYPGVGHNSWDRAYTPDNSLHTPNLYEWFLLHKLGGSPTVSAGNDINLQLPTTSVTINGTASDAGGSIVSYAWTQVGGPAVTLANAGTANVTVSGLNEGIYEFSLTVTDNESNTASDNVVVTVSPAAVNQPPTINALAPITITLPTSSTNITAVASDADGTVSSYAWTQHDGPSTASLSGIGGSVLSASALQQGTYVFRLTVTDDDAATATRDFSVIVNPPAANVPPVANAGADFSVNLPSTSTNINGSGSDTDGTITNYTWTQVAGTTVTLTNANLPTVSVSGLSAGVFRFRLTVTDNGNATHFDEVIVTVNAANIPPTANAGNDFSISLPITTTNLIGSGNDTDGSIASYAWTQIGGPTTATLTNASLATATASNLQQGAYDFRLTVTDNKGATATDVVRVTVNAAPVNVPPVAYAGPDRQVQLPATTVELNGSGTDSDGTIVSYEWIRTSGAVTSFSGQGTPTLTVNNLQAGSYRFRLTVKDNGGATHSDEVDVTVQPAVVNQAPTANAGPDQGITLPINSIELNGSGTDNDGSISTYAWSKVGGPSTFTLQDQDTQTLKASGLVQGTYTFRLTVTDNIGATHFDEVSVVVSAANLAPTANAGPDIFLTSPASSTDITGSGSDLDGTIQSYLWTVIDGTPPTLTNSTSATVSVSGLAVGTVTLRLRVTDDDGAQSTDDVRIIVNASNIAPVANAGSPVTISLPTNTTNLFGSGTDADGTIESYAWVLESGPGATIGGASNAAVTVTVTTAGTYVFRLTVTDDQGATDSKTVTVTVNAAAANQPPVADAGPNQTITLPINSTVLNATWSDSDGSASQHEWVKVSGGTAQLDNANTTSLSLSGLVEGTYVFRYTVTDDDDATASSEVTVNVLPADVNQVPVADAGDNIILTLPINSVTLFGSGSDPDGSVATYEWTQISGPASTLTNASTATLSISDLTAGIHIYRLTVIDDDDATDTDDVQVTVNAAGTNQEPIANAGPNQTISLPTNSINLNGSGSDADGTIESYFWSLVSGPPATLTNHTTPTLQLSDLVEGTYTFSLQVTDDDDASHSDLVVVQVLSEEINQSPDVNAGGDVTMILPTNSAELNGSASDPDGSVVSYVWTKVSGGAATLANEDTESLSLTDLEEGTYVFRLTVTDDDGAIGSDHVNIIVSPAGVNTPPVANAGNDRTVTLPENTLVLQGSGIDANGPIASYSWTKISGPGVTLANASTATLTVSALIEGNYVFRLTVTDEGGLTGSDDVNVAVFAPTFNQTPVANAGTDVFVELPETSITIGGTGTDNGGSITSYLWTQVSGPSTATLMGQDTDEVTVSNLAVGTYVFRLTVTDNSGLTASDHVQIIVSPADQVTIPNQPPVAFAGDDVDVVLPETSVILNGTGTDDGIISSYQWTQLSGAVAELTNADTESVTISGLTVGEYHFQLRVRDELGEEDTDEVKVTVRETMADMAYPTPLISPNGDGQNDFWVLDPDPATYNGCTVQIYNRRGSVIFETNAYGNNWSATADGVQLPEGVYFYVVKCQGTNSRSGSITVIR